MDVFDVFKKLSFGAQFAKQKTSKNDSNIENETKDCVSSPKQDKATTSKKSKSESEQFKTDQVNHIRKKNNISVLGNGIPEPIESFEEFGRKYKVSTTLLDNIVKCGYETPTAIQMQAIPAILQGKQILACAPTGSGKTAAFLIPIIHGLRMHKKIGFRAVIVSPTRELSRQTYRECQKLCEGLNLKAHITTKIKETVENPKNSTKKYDILITTPNRLVYLLNQEPALVSLKCVEWLVIDESDKLFETGKRGFRDQLATIYQACDSKNVKRMMFSATRTVEVVKWSKKNLKNCIMITIGHRNTAVESVDQKLIYVGNEDGKLIEIRNMILEGISPPVLIFLQSKERARDLFCELIYDGINVDVIHADRTQLQRDNVVKAFREGKIWVLICTELMGRGIDFKGVNLVINYDFPPTAISYIHRIGRTGRAGRKGIAVTFYTDDDIPYLKSIVNVMKESGCPVPEHLLALKKPHKKIRKKLDKKIPERKQILVKPNFYRAALEKQKKLKKEQDNKEKLKMTQNNGIDRKRKHKSEKSNKNMNVKKIKQREKNKLIHLLETSKSQSQKARSRKSRKSLMIKCYRRPAAGLTLLIPEAIRPPDILKQTVEHLLTNVLNDVRVSAMVRYNFICDRLRSVKQDGIMQRMSVEHWFQVLPPMIRFYAFSAYVHCDNVKEFDSVLNTTYLKDCLVTFLSLYTNEEWSIYLNLVAEIEAFHLIINENDAESINRACLSNISKDVFQNTLRIVLNNYQGRYYSALNLIKKLPLLHACLYAALHLNKIRKNLLQIMSYAYASKTEMYPLTKIAQLLFYNSVEEVVHEADIYKVKTTASALQFMKVKFSDEISLLKKLNCLDKRVQVSNVSDLLLDHSENKTI